MNHFALKARKQIKKIDLKSFETQWVEEGVMYMTSSTNFKVTSFDWLPVADWDWPDKIHDSRCTTISTLEDVVRILNKYLESNENHVRVYETPAGVHAFFLGEKQTPREFNWEGLNADPIYQKICIQKNKFRIRVSPKLGRTGDFVARYVCTVANCPPNLQLEKLLVQHHDKRIEEYA